MCSDVSFPHSSAGKVGVATAHFSTNCVRGEFCNGNLLGPQSIPKPNYLRITPVDFYRKRFLDPTLRPIDLEIPRGWVQNYVSESG